MTTLAILTLALCASVPDPHVAPPVPSWVPSPALLQLHRDNVRDWQTKAQPWQVPAPARPHKQKHP